jgi:serine/threonine protein kinase/tetratricopeptide (TPR) repeat protein
MSSVHPAADRNLLFGILALQMDFITRDTLIGALNAWVLDKAKPLSQILAEQGQLTPDLRHLLEAMVDKHIQVHQGDAQQSLAAVSSASSLRQELQQIADADLHASLAQVTVGNDSLSPGTASYHSTSAATTDRRYRILRPHARGGLGEVFVAEDTELHREVALKEIRAEHADNRDSRGRFVLEAEITGGLEHPGIVPVYGLGSYEDGRPFYAMRFIQGDNLKEAIERFHKAEIAQRDPTERNIAFRELLGRFVGVCNAVAFAHSRGILHRDLKPGNVMLGKYGETLVVDWGLAKPVGLAGALPGTGEVTLRPSSADSDLAVTCMGTVVGTPAFMSPEQAAGRLDQLGPASDVYSLGATLYAVLTGRAPFQGDAGAILGHVQRGDFAPPRQIKADVPAALEAVCRKAMALRPEERYRTALALAEDIEHWLADEPVSAWPEPLTLKLGRWARQHKPFVSGAAAALLVGLLAMAGGVFWYQQDRAERLAVQVRQAEQAELALSQAAVGRQALHQLLTKEGGVRQLLNQPAGWAAQLQEIKFHLDKAQALLDQAGDELDPELNQQLAALTEQLTRDEADRALATRLEKIRLIPSASFEGRLNDTVAGRTYRKAFADAQLDVLSGEPAPVAARIRQSAIKDQLAAALDDWSGVAGRMSEKSLQARLLRVARLADPGPWRDQLRDPAVWRNPHARKILLDKLRANQVNLGQLSPQLLERVGVLLIATGGDAERWLRQAQAHHPQDFWLSIYLATCLHEAKPGEAAGYCRAALAVRPQSVVAWVLLGNVLIAQQDRKGAVAAFHKALAIDPQSASVWTDFGACLFVQRDLPGAVAAYHKAVAIDPRDALAWNNLGVVLREQKNLPGAMAAYRKAVAIDPEYAKAWTNLGVALRDQKDLARAEAALRKAVAIDSHHAQAWHNLGLVLYDQNDLKRAVAAFQKVATIDPRDAQAWNNLGVSLNKQMAWPQAVSAFRKSIAINPHNASTWKNLGDALIGQQDLPGTVAVFQKVVTIDPHDAEAWTNLGVALRLQKDLAGAAAALRQAVTRKPELVQAQGGLGLALLEQGEFAEAHVATRRALQLLPPGHPMRIQLQLQLQLCQHALQQEQRSGALVHGEVQPTGPTEQLQLAQFCQSYQHYPAAAHLYAAALAAQPALAEDLNRGHRYNAACAAALAAAGQGKDAHKLTAADKENLRRQALTWLQADLGRLTKVVAAYPGRATSDRKPGSPLENLVGPVPPAGPTDLLRLGDWLRHWQTDPDLVSLRDQKALAKLLPDEQKDWQTFWAEVSQLDKQARRWFTEYHREGSLTDEQKQKSHDLKSRAGKLYVLDVQSAAFTPLLRLDKAGGQILSRNNYPAPDGNRHMQLVFAPKQDGSHRLTVGSFLNLGRGSYVLHVAEFDRPQETPPAKKER